ncbi:MAG: chromosomal replication initiator protein DnaA, partial [Chitinivibrionales bacterium]|nr:chromosomal replication initiator protein DnaA [Chitinivibrionales bacterium]
VDNMLTSPSSDSLPQTAWERCLGLIEDKIGQSSFETWFRTIRLASPVDGHVTIQVPNRFFADFIEEHFGRVIAESLNQSEIACKTLHFEPIEKDWKIIEPLSNTIKEGKEKAVRKTVEKRGLFHQNYSFDKFIVGDNNRMAHAASLAVAEAPGKTTFNPLIIHGSTGLGKTHLLQAIGQFAQKECTAENAVYLTSEEFTTQYISYVIEKKDSTSFYKRFRDTDLLLIDDIHFFSGKHGTQKEFFRIFNKLLLENKQIVLSSDRPPDKIPDMMKHIINRFLGGLITDIQPPNFETRMAILRKKAEIDGMSIPNNVIEYIANHVTSNVRELEGILIKLLASSSFTGRDITLDVTREICGDIFTQKNEPISIQFIQQRVAKEFSCSINQLTAHSRKREVSLPRYIAMYLCKKWTRQSLRSIGFAFSGRDYSTVIHACKKVEKLLADNGNVKKRVSGIEEYLQSIS